MVTSDEYNRYIYLLCCYINSSACCFSVLLTGICTNPHLILDECEQLEQCLERSKIFIFQKKRCGLPEICLQYPESDSLLTLYCLNYQNLFNYSHFNLTTGHLTLVSHNQ